MEREEEGKKERPKLRIHLLVGGLMIGLALIYDGAQNLVELFSIGFLGWIINPLISFWSFLTFYTWFSLQGVSYNQPLKTLALGSTYLLEVLPFLNDLPAITFGVIIVLAITYAEDIVAKFSTKGAAALSMVLSGPSVKKITQKVVT